MFRGFSKRMNFHGFPNQNVGSGSRVTAYGFPLCSFWLNAEAGLNAVSNFDPISTWIDQAGQIPFIQNTASLQPRLLKNVTAFGGRDMVDFHTSPRGLESDFLTSFSPQKTLALVYDYSAFAGGGNAQSRILGDKNFANARSTGSHFSYSQTNNTGFRPWVGYGEAANILYGTADTGAFNNLPKILIITSGSLVVNGASVPLTIPNSPFFTAPFSWVGAPSSAFVGVFRLGEVLLYDRIFSLSECIDLSNTLNQKYALY